MLWDSRDFHPGCRTERERFPVLPAADTCTATGDWSGSMPVSGSTGVLVIMTSFFQLDCVDALGSPGGDSNPGSGNETRNSWPVEH